MIRSNLNVVLRIIVCFNSHLRHFFLKLYRFQQTNINISCTLFLSVRQKKGNWKWYHFYKQHSLTVFGASMYVISFFNWSAQQIKSDNNCIFLLSSCQNQIEIDRSISQSQKWPFITRRFVLEITAKCFVITHLMSLVVCTQLQHWSWGTAPESGDI